MGGETDRIARLQQLLGEHDVDGLLLNHLPDVRWACGFTGTNGLLLVLGDAAHFVTDGRYREQAGHEVNGAQVHVPGYQLVDHLVDAELLSEVETLAFQSDHVTVATADAWREQLDGVKLVGWPALTQQLRGVKGGGEIVALRRAQALTEEVFRHLLDDVLRPGVSEREIAAEIAYQHLRRGATEMSFPPIVASGPNGALPHARATERRIERGDLVVIDMGGYVDGYASDMTRTVAVGEPGAEARAVYDVVRRAQEEAVSAARAGLTSKQLDAVARDVIVEAGYGEAFGHSLGHGVGLEVHEWPPVSYRSDDELPAGAAVTIEPGVYLEGRFGVRIEDIIVLREEGCQNLNSAPKALIVL